MSLRGKAKEVLFVCTLALSVVAPAWAEAQAAQGSTRVVGVVRDETNAIALPGVPVEVVETKEVVYTDVDGRYVLQVPPGKHKIKIALEGYQEKSITIEAAGRTLTADVGLTMAKFAETVTVVAQAVDVETSSAEAQLIERKQASVITDNVGSQEMKNNGDSDAAAAMSRVTGLSLVDNQYVFVRGLGERYSNTTLAGSVLPTTEPDKKVVPLDLFPTGLIDSVQVSKSYSPDRSAEFAGGLVQIVPMKLPNQPVVDFSYGLRLLLDRDGQEHSAEPARQPRRVGLRQRRARAAVGLPGRQDRAAGHLHARRRLHGRTRSPSSGGCSRTAGVPVNENGKPGQNWSATFGNRFGKLGRRRERHALLQGAVRRGGSSASSASRAPATLENTSDYHMQTGTQKAQLGIVGNLSYQFTPNQRLSFENFYTHSGRDEGRFFQGVNLDNAREYQNYRLQFIEEGLMANAVGGEHFFQNAVEQPHRLARELRARDARRAGPARDALRAAGDCDRHSRRRRRRSPTPTSRRAASACSTS